MVVSPSASESADARTTIAPRARTSVLAAIGSYYTFMDGGDRLAANVLSTPRAIRDAVATFASLGADEVIRYCWARDAGQVDRLADAVA